MGQMEGTEKETIKEKGGKEEVSVLGQNMNLYVGDFRPSVFITRMLHKH